jgi:predicted DNA-binding antitoxin AbrB/MazE fold protein
MSIKVRFEGNVFRPLGEVKLEQGVEGRVRITNKKDILRMASLFSGIGGYRGKITASKLEELEEEMHA